MSFNKTKANTVGAKQAIFGAHWLVRAQRLGGKFESSVSHADLADSLALHRVRLVHFTDPQLQECYERNFIQGTGISADLRPVYALIAVHEVLRLVEGPHSPRMHAVVEQLLLPALRPMLRSWYRRSGPDDSSEEIELREQLSQLTGECL